MIVYRTMLYLEELRIVEGLRDDKKDKINEFVNEVY